MNDSIGIPPPSPTQPSAPHSEIKAPRAGSARSGFALLVLGLSLISTAALNDAREVRQAPWAGAVFSPQGESQWQGSIPIRARRLSLSNYPIRQRIHRELMKTLAPEDLRALGIERAEWLIVVYAPVATLEPVLASGRMPRPGYPEVLAGALTTRDEINADDGRFQVVGRLSRTAGGLATAYVMPAHDVWEPLFERTTTWGWLDPQGVNRIAEAPVEPSERDGAAELYGGMFPASPWSVWCSLAGLVLAAAGGSVLHRVAFRRVRAGPFAPACMAFTDHPGVVRGLHVALYGGFFGAMLLAVLAPPLNLLIMNLITHAFSEGNLGYVGDAYRSGNIASAAAATWVNNYLLQTVVLTVFASLIVPCIGILKTLLSFGVAGLVMAPVWSGTAANYTFHSITIVLELEAYIYACAAVAIFWIRITEALRHHAADPVWEGARVLVSATLLAGVLLGIAGIYEAGTLILLR